MVQDFTTFRKISFQTVEVEVALAEIEYQYLKFVCEATLRNSDEVVREQIRQLQIAGLPSFDEWRKQEVAAVRGILAPAIEAKTIPTTAIESDDRAVEPTVKPAVEPSTPVSDRKPSTSTVKPSTTKTAKKQSGDVTDKLLKVLSEPATAKLTSREVIEQQHEQLTVLLKEGKTMEDLADLLTSNGAKISASTLRNYLSAARRKAKGGNAAIAKKKVSVDDATPTDSVAVPDAFESSQLADAVSPSTAETATDAAPEPTKPTEVALKLSPSQHRSVRPA